MSDGIIRRPDKQAGLVTSEQPDASALRRCPTPGSGKSEFPPNPAFLNKSSEDHNVQTHFYIRRWLLPGLLSLTLYASVPAAYALRIEAGFSPEGTALQLVLKTIESAQHEIRLMGYSFTSPEVTRALVSAKHRGVDVKVVLDR